MRIPIAIVMLCLPVAAMGEIYVCTTENSAFLSDSGANANNSSSGNGWVVDTNLGFRKLKVEGTTDYRGTDYRGKCQESEYRIVCDYEDGITLENILLDLSEGSYTYSQHSMGGTLFSSFGTCTKL